MVNRTQALVLGFFLMVLTSLVVILAAAPDIYNQALRLPSNSPRWMALTLLAGLGVFIGLLAVGVLRCWRWTFWVILVAFLAGYFACRWLACSLPACWLPMVRPGMSCSRDCSASCSSPSGWPWWPATAALASGEPSRSGLLGSCAASPVVAHPAARPARPARPRSPRPAGHGRPSGRRRPGGHPRAAAAPPFLRAGSRPTPGPPTWRRSPRASPGLATRARPRPGRDDAVAPAGGG